MSAFVLALFSLLCTVWAGSPAASTIYINGSDIAFAINLPSNSSDLYFSFSAPAQSWSAVGAGDSMAGSLMFVLYASNDASNVTLSTRIGTGNTEPAFAPEIDIEVLEGSGFINELYYVNAVCHNCRSWPGGSLDLNSETQPWIYAVGPNVGIESDSPSAGLRRHKEYGYFTMNMQQATGPGGLPNVAGVTSSNGAAVSGSPVSDGDKSSAIHAIILIISIVALYPFNMVIIEVFKWRNAGIFVSIPFHLAMLTGFALGVYVSTEYIRSQKFNSPHQIIGFIVVFGFLVDGVMGFVLIRRHNNAKRTGTVLQQDHLETLHTWIKRILWLLAIVDGGLGLTFASASTTIKVVYSICIVVVVILMTPFYCCLWRRFRKSRKLQKEINGHVPLSDFNQYPGGAS